MNDMPQVNLLYDVQPTVLTLCKQGANRKRIFLMKEEGETGEESGLIQLPSPHDVIRKADAGSDWSYFYCVVAEPGASEDPGIGDGRGGPDDMWRDSEEIRKAAHFFAKSERLVTGLHGTMKPYGTVVENAIAQDDFTVMDPTGNAQVIKKGSWYVGIEPSDEGKVAIDSGEFTGLSLEGTGMRQLSDLQKSADEDEKVGVFRKLGEMLGITLGPLPKDSTTVESETPEQEDDVADNEKITAIEGQVAEIAKAQGAATTAIEGLVGTVNSLIERLDSKNKEEEPPATAEDLKKSFDEFIESTNTKLSELGEGIDALADPGSVQDPAPDRIEKSKSDNPLSGILD